MSARGLGRAGSGGGGGAGGGRHRDRPRPVGRGADRGRVRGVRDQPDVGGALPGSALHLGSEKSTPVTRMCWPRSCAWIGPTTDRSPVDSTLSQAMKLVARSHQSLIWERTRHVLRLRSTLREFFPAALARSRTWTRAKRWSCSPRPRIPIARPGCPKAKIAAALRRARRRKVAERTEHHPARRCGPRQLRQPAPIQSAYAVITASEVRVISALAGEIDGLGEVVAEHFGRHRDADIYASQPGLGVTLAPGSSASPAMPPTATSTPEPAATTPAPHRSPRHPGPSGSCSPATPATEDSATRCANGRSGHCEAPPAPGLLRRLARPQDRTRSRAAAARQPTRRHPARLPQDPHLYDEATAGPSHHRRLTSKKPGCLRAQGAPGRDVLRITTVRSLGPSRR